MKLGIMQPYFFPYLGYFYLLASVDLLIIYDNVQFSKGGWLNRNRILHPSSSWQYITVPLEKASYQGHIKNAIPIEQIKLSMKLKWRQRILNQLEHYKKTAPFYKSNVERINHSLFVSSQSAQYISELNTATLDDICNLLGIKFHYQLASKMDIDLEPDISAQEKVLRICAYLGATEYVNLPGGKLLYDEISFVANGITLKFCELPVFKYNCDPYEFIPNLSIIDLLMWNSPQEIKAHLDKHAF